MPQAFLIACALECHNEYSLLLHSFGMSSCGILLNALPWYACNIRPLCKTLAFPRHSLHNYPLVRNAQWLQDDESMADWTRGLTVMSLR